MLFKLEICFLFLFYGIFKNSICSEEVLLSKCNTFKTGF